MKHILLICLLLGSMALFAGTAHPVYVGITNPNGAVTWQAWNLAAPGDIITQDNTGCSWNALQNLVTIQCGSFAAQWNAGETIHVEAVDAVNAVDSYELVLTTAGFQYFPDAMTLVPSGPVVPSLATLVTPVEGSIIPPEMVLLDWAYSGVGVTGFEIWLGLNNGEAAIWVADVTNGDTAYNAGNLVFSADYEWLIKPYIEESTQKINKFNHNKAEFKENSRGGREERTYPTDPILTWTFSIYDPTPPPPPPIVPAGGGTTSFDFNGGTGTGGAGSTINFTPPANGGTGAVSVEMIDPTTTGIPLPENVIAVYDISGYNGDFPVQIVFEWEYPAPTGTDNPVLLVSTDEGNTFINVSADPEVSNVNWNLVSSPYSVTFDTMHLSEWASGNGGDNPLPVSLSSFTGSYEDDAPLLNWTTQSETDNLGWNIYRSVVENGFEMGNTTQINVNMIDGMGICTEPTDYTFIDEYPVVEGVTYWYWLESVSTTNELEQNGPVSIEIPIQGEIPNAIIETYLNPNYPNPFNPTTTISFSIEEGEKGLLSIFNIKGQVVFEEKFDTGEYFIEWNAEGLASGIYFYKLSSPTMNITKKMILMK